MHTRSVLALSALLASTALAQDLTLAELARRPEFVPAQTTLKQPVKLQGRPAIKAGQRLTVVSVRGTSVEFETPIRGVAEERVKRGIAVESTELRVESSIFGAGPRDRRPGFPNHRFAFLSTLSTQLPAAPAGAPLTALG